MNAARTLVVAAVAAAVLAGCGGGNGSSAPVRSGGTTGDMTTTLTPVGSATPAQLSASANIVRARLTAVGIVAHVNVSDGAVVVSAPAPARTAVATAALPGVLSFREFYQGYVAGPAIASAKPSADETFTGLGAPPNEPDQAAPSQVTQAALTSLDCATGGGRAPTIDEDPHHFVVACSSDGATKYLLAPADLTGAQVASATATQGQTSLGGQHAVWEVDLTFKDSAVSQVEKVSTRLSDNNRQQLAVTLDGVVVAAPATNGVLGKNITILGGIPSFSKDEAQALAAVISSGPLPVAFTVGGPR